MDNENKFSYTSNSSYLHNTKTTSYEIQQEANEKSHNRKVKHSDGLCAALTDMFHVMLRYREVYADLQFVSIFIMSLKLCMAKNINLDVTCISDQVCSNK